MEDIDEVKATARAQADVIFAQLDLNQNGYIDKEELLRLVTSDPNCMPLPTSVAEGMSQEQQIDKLFADADSNRDGRIDREEFYNYRDRLIDEMYMKLYQRLADSMKMSQ